MKNRDYITCIQSVLQLMDEGVHIVDPEGRSVVYNRAMAQLEKMETRDVLRKPFSEVFKGLTPENSTLLQALETGKSTWKKEQTYLNKDGKQITTMNTTVPVVEDGKVIAAVEIAKNITDIQQMTSTIIELRKEIDTPRKARDKQIRHYSFSDLYGQTAQFLKTVELAKKEASAPAS